MAGILYCCYHYSTESLDLTLFDVKYVKIGPCSDAFKRVTLLAVQDNVVRRVSSYNHKKYLKYEKDALEEASNFLSLVTCQVRMVV